jgi:hypothetical protein
VKHGPTARVLRERGLAGEQNATQRENEPGNVGHDAPNEPQSGKSHKGRARRDLTVESWVCMAMSELMNQ